MTLEQLLEEFSKLSSPGKAFKPHKHLLLLAVLQLTRQSVIRTPRIVFDETLRSAFSALVKQCGGDVDRDRPHTPFFHLSRHSFWRLIPKQGLESALDSVSTVGSGGDLQRLVGHAELEQSVFDLFKDPSSSERVEQELELLVRSGIASRSESNSPHTEVATLSLFAHEAAALDSISQQVESHALGIVLPNLELHDPQSNRYFEIDLVLLSRFGIYVIELKHWSGRIEIRPNSWLQNGSFFKTDPHKANNFKAKLLRGLYERKFPQFPSTYFESIVVLTNPDVLAQGASIPTTTANNPTFDSIDRFLQYLKNQRKNGASQLTDSQCQAFADHLQKLQTTGPPRDFVFPGYEVVERLYQYIDRAEVIAKRTDLRHRKLSRLRIFNPTAERSEEDRQRAHERATATLNAVAKIGEHPNILKVWAVPNENNYLVEGSDWSETGTLRDVIEREGALSVDRAMAIAAGLLRGLYAIHQQYVVHRALSPENILMVDNIPKLMNFDLSFQLEEDRVTVIPDATKLKRSPYFAPEIYTSGDIPDGKADLFSVGVILYETLTGRRPFGCSTDLERSNGRLADSHRQELGKHDVPINLVELVFDLVQQLPGRKPADAQLVLRRLEGFQIPSAALLKVNPVLVSGDRSGVYAIEEFLGYGAESQIYRAAGMGGRKIVLKIFDRDVPQQHVVNEHRLTGTILHPTIVRVDSYNQWADNRYFIAFEWVSQRNLRHDILETVRPDIQRFSNVANQVLSALGALHQNSDEDGRPNPILHNDIKPENILLAAGDRPVLVDFGVASEPHVGTYQGTEGYVAPDLRLGQDRKYNEDGDLYALAVTLHEWLLGSRPHENRSINTEVPKPLLDWLHKGSALEAAQRFTSVNEMREELALALAWKEPPGGSALKETATLIEQDSVVPETSKPELPEIIPTLVPDPNPFVPYLNSLHSRSAETDNALAESQARSPFFGFIHVPHPLVSRLETILLGTERRHVIVTGHAGDGKSTIAVELIKRLRGMPIDKPLSKPLERREDIRAEGVSISLIKDFSEWSATEREALLGEMLDSGAKRFLLVSNTGTMLDTFKVHEQARNGDWVQIESDLLGAMAKSPGSDITFHGTSFSLFNIAMIDNLDIAQLIFRRMLAAERWQACHASECRDYCPIFRNVTLMQANQEVVTERLFLAYRRMYEYGTRLTLRQLSAHIAYSITSGLSYEDVVKISQRARRPPVSEYMFFNRFFGDNGKEVDEPALQLRGVREARAQGFGAQSCATWERKVWLASRGATFQLRASDAPDDFASLQATGAGLQSSDLATPAQAREQVRRVVFFLHGFDKSEAASFISAFLRSVMLLDFSRWQTQQNETLSLQESTSLHRRILHVLQEHFTGVRLPEGAASDRHLFVTLNRRSHNVRQSAQVVLARYPEDDFRVRLRTESNGAGGLRRELVLEGQGQSDGLVLALGLPFLDYVMLRNEGAVGKELQASYVDRLEIFKGQLIRYLPARNADDIMLVRLRTNNTFRRQVFSVRGKRLEVADG